MKKNTQKCAIWKLDGWRIDPYQNFKIAHWWLDFDVIMFHRLENLPANGSSSNMILKPILYLYNKGEVDWKICCLSLTLGLFASLWEWALSTRWRKREEWGKTNRMWKIVSPHYTSETINWPTSDRENEHFLHSFEEWCICHVYPQSKCVSVRHLFAIWIFKAYGIFYGSWQICFSRPFQACTLLWWNDSWDLIANTLFWMWSNLIMSSILDNLCTAERRRRKPLCGNIIDIFDFNVEIWNTWNYVVRIGNWY